MISNPRPTTPPIITLTQAHATLRIDTTDEDTLLTDLIDGASEAAEEALSSSLLTRTIVAVVGEHRHEHLFYDWWHSRDHVLPRGPVQSITSIVDATGTAVTRYTLGYVGNTDYVRIHQNYTGPLTVTYVAGYGSEATAVPADIRLAIRSHVASLWAVRESIADVTMTPVPHSLAMFYAGKRRGCPVA